MSDNKEKNMNDDRDEILINKMFAGSYKEKNIGHEIINLFSTDKGKTGESKYYIYVLSYGGIAKKHNNKINSILLVKGIKKNSICEVIGKATKLTQLYFDGDKGSKTEHDAQTKYIKENDIRYGGILLNEIFRNNSYNESSLYYTFEAKSIVTPKNKIYIARKTERKNMENETKGLSDEEKPEIIYVSKKFKFPGEKNRSFISKKDNKTNYMEIEDKIIKNDTLWNQEPVGNVDIENKKYENIGQFNFLKLIGREYDENAFSNMIAYYFNNIDKCFNKFLKEKEKGIDDETYFEFTREKVIQDNKRIDIWAENKSTVVVIENKIKSHLNGKNNKENQLDVYTKYTDKYCKDKEKEAKYFIFVPNYNLKHIEKEMSEKNKFKIITYKELYDFFEKFERQKFDGNTYYKDFLSALLIHTYNEEDEMESKFVAAIKSEKKQS